MQTFRSLTALARAVGLDYRVLKKERDVLLTDPEIAKKYGPVKPKRLTVIQNEILIKNIPDLHHLDC